MTTQKESGHDDVIKWKHFPRYWPFVRGIQGRIQDLKLGVALRGVAQMDWKIWKFISNSITFIIVYTHLK